MPTSVDELENVDAVRFAAEVAPAYRPVVLRGLVADWPAVAAARSSAAAAVEHIARFDSGVPAEVMIAPPQEKGRFFYASDMRGFNFGREKLGLTLVGRRLVEQAGRADAPAVYAGATATCDHLPGFDAANPAPLPLTGAMSRVWLGNAVQVATHYDLSDNVAAIVLGRRRFTLFPPQATADLYVGPLNVTLAGQPVSMVDPQAPDLDRYPRFAKAWDQALVAELEPGDAIYIPTLWWHHVASLDPVNILVNYWHNDTPHGGPFTAFLHALAEVRDLPPPQREAWRAWFDHFVFADDAASTADHLPAHARGVQGPSSQQRSDAIRTYVARALGRRG